MALGFHTKGNAVGDVNKRHKNTAHLFPTHEIKGPRVPQCQTITDSTFSTTCVRVLYITWTSAGKQIPAACEQSFQYLLNDTLSELSLFAGVHSGTWFARTTGRFLCSTSASWPAGSSATCCSALCVTGERSRAL